MGFRRFAGSLSCAAIAGALVLTNTAPASAASACWSADLVRAARLRQLDVMLMVGSLRCRTTAQDYRTSYDRFLVRHRPMLSKANLAMLGEMRLKLGSIGASDMLDRASVRMANQYGKEGGYSCAELGEATAALATGGPEALTHAADVLIGEDVALVPCPVQVATAVLPARRR